MKKRVILITIDCLRKDHLKLYGYSKETAPNIEKFSKNAIIFDNTIANGSNTPSSFYSIFTSTTPTTQGSYAPIPSNKKKISEILQCNKISTCGIHSNPHLGFFCNYHMGFDDFFDIFENPQFSLKKKLIDKINSFSDLLGFSKYINKLKQKFLTIIKLKEKFSSFETNKLNSPYSNAKIIVTETLKWLKDNQNSNFFLWIHFMDVHRPYYPPSKYIKKVSNVKISEPLKVFLNELFNKYKKDQIILNRINEKHINALNVLYDSEIYYVDHYLGILFSYLKKIEIFKSTNIIITSDHGQALFDHNQLSHGVSLYDELLKVPFILKLEKSSNKQKRIKEHVELIDISPTILDLFNLPKEIDFSGKSLIPLIERNFNYDYSDNIISAIYHYQGKMFSAFIKENYNFFILISCRKINWKLIYNDETKDIELFNLKNDPLELNDLSNDSREEISFIKNKLFQKLKPFIKKFNSEEEKIKTSINNKILKFL